MPMLAFPERGWDFLLGSSMTLEWNFLGAFPFFFNGIFSFFLTDAGFIQNPIF